MFRGLAWERNAEAIYVRLCRVNALAKRLTDGDNSEESKRSKRPCKVSVNIIISMRDTITTHH